jgi:hypothetical protein
MLTFKVRDCKPVIVSFLCDIRFSLVVQDPVLNNSGPQVKCRLTVWLVKGLLLAVERLICVPTSQAAASLTPLAKIQEEPSDIKLLVRNSIILISLDKKPAQCGFNQIIVCGQVCELGIAECRSPPSLALPIFSSRPYVRTDRM